MRKGYCNYVLYIYLFVHNEDGFPIAPIVNVIAIINSTNIYLTYFSQRLLLKKKFKQHAFNILNT